MSSEAPAVGHWHKALVPNEHPEGRVTAANGDGTTVCLTHFDGQP